MNVSWAGLVVAALLAIWGFSLGAWRQRAQRKLYGDRSLRTLSHHGGGFPLRTLWHRAKALTTYQNILVRHHLLATY